MPPKLAICTAPVADVRREPIASQKVREKDLLQETQVLYGDTVEVLEERDTWAQVVIPDQPIFDVEKGGFTGYSGWVEKRFLTFQNEPYHFTSYVTQKSATITKEDGTSFRVSMGTKLYAQDEKIRLVDGLSATIEKDALIKPSFSAQIELLSQHVGDPYYWGGLSSFNPHNGELLTGIDCSALVYLFFRLQGAIIPRNAKDQFRLCNIVDGKDLVPGDLIFLKSELSGTIGHVMIYYGDDCILESTLRSNSVRFISSTERMGAPISELSSGHIFEDHEFFFAAYKTCPHHSNLLQLKLK